MTEFSGAASEEDKIVAITEIVLSLGTATAVRKGIPHNHVDLPPLVSVEATGVCIPIGNSQVLLAAVCKYPGRAWSDADITELLRFRRKTILTGELRKNSFLKS
jgi:hypothetical protein